MPDNIDNTHKGHRERLKRKFLNSAGENFEPHEALELLLFYALPQKDTNKIAHELLKHFGSLSGVFEAQSADLMKVEGIKEHAATLIKLQTAMFRMYEEDKYFVKNMQFTPENATKFIISLFRGYTIELFYAVMLDADYHYISLLKISEGTNDSSPVYPREIVKRALETNAKNVVLAHNHPNGPLIPSVEDIQVTEIVQKALEYVNVDLVDHLIVGDNRVLSILHEIEGLNFCSIE